MADGTPMSLAERDLPTGLVEYAKSTPVNWNVLPATERASLLVLQADQRRRSGRLTDAEQLLREALVTSNDGMLRAKALHKLAVVHRRRAQYDAAERCARRAVALLEQADSPALLGNHLMFLATLLVGEERDGEALEVVERALPLYEEELGPDHLEVAFVLSVAVRLCRSCNRSASARYYERRRMSIAS